MRRREFITLIGSAATWPLAAKAQSRDRLRRVALLMGFPEGDAEGRACASAFQRRLEELGWADGRNIQIDTRMSILSSRAPVKPSALFHANLFLGSISVGRNT